MDDDTTVETDRSTAAERVPVEGAYNITEVGDSARAGWWEREARVIRWRNLRWWAAGVVLVSVPAWAVIWVPGHTKAAFMVLLVAALTAIVSVRLLRWYLETAEKWATVRVKRKQARLGIK